jgi:hypothetical protein
VILEGGGEKAAYLKEPWMDVSSCRWVKWTRNDGHLFPGECVPGRFPHVAVAGKKAGRQIDLQGGALVPISRASSCV